MKFEKTLKVSSEEFYNFILASVLKDVNENSDEEFELEDLVQGFTYSKNLQNKFGQDGNTVVRINELDANKIYEVIFESHQGENIMTYKLLALDNQEVHVTYEEDFIASNAIKKLNYQLVSFFYNKKSQKKADQLLRNIEHFIIQYRETENK